MKFEIISNKKNTSNQYISHESFHVRRRLKEAERERQRERQRETEWDREIERGEDWHEEKGFLKNVYFLLSSYWSSKCLEIFRASESLSGREARWSVSGLFFVKILCFYDWSLQYIVVYVYLFFIFFYVKN